MPLLYFFYSKLFMFTYILCTVNVQLNHDKCGLNVANFFNSILSNIPLIYLSRVSMIILNIIDY